MDRWETYLRERQSRSLDELLELLRIPSISALPEHAGDVQRAAEWSAGRLRAAGVENVQIMDTGGHPVVYGDWLHAPGKPTVLIYGHFDVQPVDPIELWTSPPFEPAVRDGRVYARGASDMKGNLMITVLAVEGWLKGEGHVPVNVKFFLEGQEEIGSPELPAFVAANRDLLACDLVISADGAQAAENQPVILVALKGLAGIQIDVHGAATDLHSGLFGGAVHNPIHALIRILDSMRAPDGKITVDGFLDDVVPLSERDRAEIAAVPFDEAEYREMVGAEELFGDPDYTPLERVWARPTLEINGIWGGFQGEGIKTVIPNEAHAKISCRLVPNQEPARIANALEAHVRRHAQPGVAVTTTRLPGSARPYYVDPDYWGNQVAAEVLTEVYGKRPYQVRLGGSIPVCETFLSCLGAYTVELGFGLDDEQFHAPNEFWRLSSFEKGQRAWSKILEQLGRHTPG